MTKNQFEFSNSNRGRAHFANLDTFFRGKSYLLAVQTQSDIFVHHGKPGIEDSKSPASFSLSMDTSAVAKCFTPIAMNFVLSGTAPCQGTRQWFTPFAIDVLNC